jgi:hypothetical protein
VIVSYGGKEMYQSPDGPYSMFVGIDASRALAKMSFDPDDLKSHDISDLTEEERKVHEVVLNIYTVRSSASSCRC